MRRLLSLLGLLLVSAPAGACGGPPDPGEEPVARVGDDTLTVRRLAELLVLAQPMPLETLEVEKLVRHWLEVTALGNRLASGDSLLSRATVERATRFDAQDELFSRYRAREGRAELTDAQVDSVFEAGELLLLGHFFRAAGEGIPVDQRRAQLQAVQQMREILLRTGALDEANRLNQDPFARQNGGLILVAPGELPSRVEQVARALEPGQLSEVLASEAGFHVLLRPRLRDVREIYAEQVRDRLDAADESAQLEGLYEGADVTVEPGAVVAVRRAARTPLQALSDQQVLARWSGGSVTTADVAETLMLLPLEGQRALGRARDAELRGYLQQVVLRRILEDRAAGQGILLPDSVRDRIATDYRSRLETIRSDAELGAGEVAAMDGEELHREIDRRVERYFDAIVSRRAELEPVPPLLAAELLKSTEWGLDRAAMSRALAMSRRLLDEAGYTGPGQLPSQDSAGEGG